jgi:hypothetical protein
MMNSYNSPLLISCSWFERLATYKDWPEILKISSCRDRNPSTNKKTIQYIMYSTEQFNKNTKILSIN